MYRNPKRRIKSGIIFIIFFVIVSLYQHASDYFSDFSKSPDSSPLPTVSDKGEYPLSVHFIYVGQGDSTLISLPDGKHILIDAGEEEYAENVIDALNSVGCKKIDYLIATHPHSDHIGGICEVLKYFDVESIYMPDAEYSSGTYLNFLEAIAREDLKINRVTAGLTMIASDNLHAQFIAPNSIGYDELNDYSAVLKLTYKNTSFLFCGDAEAVSENEILSSGFNVSADVLKLGHHGSNTSTTSDFLNTVNPKYAIASCGIDNDYNHPSKETLKRLSNKNIPVLRTDQMGTITMYSDGEKIYVED